MRSGHYDGRTLTSLAQFERQLPGPEREFQLCGMEEGPLVVLTGIEPESPKNANDAEGFDVIDISKLKSAIESRLPESSRFYPSIPIKTGTVSVF
jgi:hypothetical protein